MRARTTFTASALAAAALVAAALVACRAAAPASGNPADASAPCPGLAVVVVHNDSRETLDVYSTRDRRVLLGTIEPGRAELVIGRDDTQFVALRSGTQTLVGASTSQRTGQAVRFVVVCRVPNP